MYRHMFLLLFSGCRTVEDESRRRTSHGLALLEPLEHSTIATRGFANMGNTCYLNAMLQVLVHANSVRKSYDAFVVATEDTNLTIFENIHNEFALIVRRQWNVSKTYHQVPIRVFRFFDLLNRVDGSLFRLGTQQDAHEALLSVIAATETDREGTLSNLFKFETVSVLVCHSCSTVPEPKLSVENQVIIPLEKDENIYSVGWGVSQRFGPEHLEDVRCQGCEQNPQLATRVHAISTHPKLLLVVIQRSDAFGSKIHTRIILDQRVLLGREWYKLIGVVHHHGNSVSSGHYTADFYHAEVLSWYHADDNVVSKVKDKKIVSRTAYILLYELI